MNKLGIIGAIIIFTLIGLGIIGWVKDVVYLTRTDFKAPYKAEVIYGFGAVTGAGAVIGWIKIND